VRSGPTCSPPAATAPAFAGAPWTLATYMVGGGRSRNFAATKGWAYRDPESFGRLIETVREALEQSGIPTESAELAMLPKSTVKLEGREAEQMLRLMEALEDNDDVQNVYANFDISEEQMAEASA